MKYVLSGIFCWFTWPTEKAVLHFTSVQSTPSLCTTAFRVHYEWVVIDWLTLDDDQEKWLIKMHFSTLSLFGHHYVYQRCVHTCILYTMLSSTIQSFICIIGFACLLNVPLASAAIWQFYLPRTNNVKMYFKGGNFKLY